MDVLKGVEKYLGLCAVAVSLLSCSIAPPHAEPLAPLQTVDLAHHSSLTYPVVQENSRLVQGFNTLTGVCGDNNWEPKLRYKTQKQCNHAGMLWHSQHTGIDIAATGVVRVIADGELVFKQKDYPGYGNVKVFRHADGNCSLYAHLQNDALWSADHAGGEKRGDPIGLVGNTGAGGLTLLHFAVYQCRMPLPGKHILPPPYLKMESKKSASHVRVSAKNEIDYFCNPQRYIMTGQCIH